jgi:hypothetical protein
MLNLRSLFFIALSSSLVACGGGGSSSSKSDQAVNDQAVSDSSSLSEDDTVSDVAEIDYYDLESLHDYVLQYDPVSTKDDHGKLYLYETFFGNKDFKYGLSTFIKNVPEAHHLAKYKIYTDRDMQDELIDKQLSYAINHAMLAGTNGADHRNQMLFEWAVKEMRRLGLTPGKPLTYSQQRKLKHVIIWPELHRFDGIESVFPRVYVTQAAVDEFKGATSLIIAGTINMNIGHLELGPGDVIHGRNGVRISAEYADISGGKIESRDGDVEVIVGATEHDAVEEGDGSLWNDEHQAFIDALKDQTFSIPSQNDSRQVKLDQDEYERNFLAQFAHNEPESPQQSPSNSAASDE